MLWFAFLLCFVGFLFHFALLVFLIGLLNWSFWSDFHYVYVFIGFIFISFMKERGMEGGRENTKFDGV